MADVRSCSFPAAPGAGRATRQRCGPIQALAAAGSKRRSCTERAGGAPAFSPERGTSGAGSAADLKERGSRGPVRWPVLHPEYAGTMPAALKTCWTGTVARRDLRQPAGWVNVAVGRPADGAEEHLAMVLRYVGAVAVDGACVACPSSREAVGRTGSSRTRANHGEVLLAPCRGRLPATLTQPAGLP